MEEDTGAVGAEHDIVAIPNIVGKLVSQDHVATRADFILDGNDTDTGFGLDDSLEFEEDFRIDAGNKMDDIKERMIADAVSMHGELDDAHEIMLEEWKSETPNLGTIDTQIDAGMELKKGFARKIAGTLLEVHDILTPEQREIVSAQIEEHMSHMRQFLKTR